MVRKVVAVGDCNTLGAGEYIRRSYPELFGLLSGAEVRNIGHTMATTREGLSLLRDNMDDADCVIIQFGLVDSYYTFRYSPYVLYYPDNILRKQLRSVAKKFKKSCRSIGLNRVFGEVNVVPIDEYEKNIRQMIEIAGARMVAVLDTVPNKQRERNREIIRYNRVLTKICGDYKNCKKINLFDIFVENLDKYYMDETHCNELGYERIAKILLKEVEEVGLHD